MLHQVGVSFDLYCDARKHKIKVPGNSENQFANQMYTFCEINWEGLSKSGGHI